MTTKAKIEEILRKQFRIDQLEVIDDSAKHAGHEEAKRSGGGHYQVNIVSVDFEGKTSIERHRMINAALKSLFSENIHALSINARST